MKKIYGGNVHAVCESDLRLDDHSTDVCATHDSVMKAKLDLEPADHLAPKPIVNKSVNLSDAIRGRVRKIFANP